MRRTFKKGEKGSVLEGVIVLTTLILIMVLFVLPDNNKGPLKPIIPLEGSVNTGHDTSGASNGATYATISSAGSPNASSYANSISLGAGNASYAIQPYEEYITIYNHGSSAINITGWKLKNDKENRVIYEGGTERRYRSDMAIIPSADTGNVVLKPGEIAIVNTGLITNYSPYRITSFKENICSGYIEATGDYNFTPSLSVSCPTEQSANLDVKCRDFVNSISSCHIPQFGSQTSQGDYCENCVDGVLLPSSCVAFLKSRYNYASCVSNHRNDPNFYLNTWRVYLGRGWEMWADRYETIYLYDQYGKLVTYVTY